MTRDIAASVRGQLQNRAKQTKAVCDQDVMPDGVIFHSDTVQGIAIKEDADYLGVRVTFRATIRNARLPMQIDTGFGDVVNPAPAIIEYPALLDFEPARLAAYPAETVIAEKFEAMVKLGQLNSRMKDFYDILILSRQFAFDGPRLATAIKATFQNRGTRIRTDASLFSSELADDNSKQLQWTAFVRKSRIEGVPAAFPDVVSELVRFLLPVTQSIERVGSAAIAWRPDRGWQEL